MPLGELRPVRTRACDGVSGIDLGRKMRTTAILGDSFSSSNLYEFLSYGAFKNRSALGYPLSMCSTMDGPVSSNRRAAPTKQTAILDWSNAGFPSLRASAVLFVNGGGDLGFMAGPELRGVRRREESGWRRARRERVEIVVMMRRRRELRDDSDDLRLITCILIFGGNLSIFLWFLFQI